jgi:hypothetical protein
MISKVIENNEFSSVFGYLKILTSFWNNVGKFLNYKIEEGWYFMRYI